jgi:hypothetical protein
MVFLGTGTVRGVSSEHRRKETLLSQARFQKQQREKARRERAAAKFAKRAERANAEVPESAEPIREEAEVLAELATLHARFEAGELSFEDFEVTRQQVTDQLDVR